MIKPLYIVATLTLALASCQATSEDNSTETTSENTNASDASADTNAANAQSTGYDANMAREVGADEYGMRQYVFAYLKRGPNRDLSPEETEELQRAHLNNIQRLAQEGKLVLAGPFMDEGDTRGIYVFAVESLEEAEKIAFSDPAIEAGSLVMELHPWYGSAALMKINELHAKVAKENI